MTIIVEFSNLFKLSVNLPMHTATPRQTLRATNNPELDVKEVLPMLKATMGISSVRQKPQCGTAAIFQHSHEIRHYETLM